MDLESTVRSDLEQRRATDGAQAQQASARTLSWIFRSSYWLQFLTYVAAFAISWATPQRIGVQRIWLALPQALYVHFGMDLHTAIVAVTALAVLLALAGALLRTWGAAHLGATDLPDTKKRAKGIGVRYVRNPLYAGTVSQTFALSVLMSWSGAAFAILGTFALQIAMVFWEGQLLRGLQGGFYSGSDNQVSRVATLRRKTHWGRAVGTEIFTWGVAISFAAFGATYNSMLILQGVLVSAGLSIVVRGIVAKR